METRSLMLDTAHGPMRLYEAVPVEPRGAIVVIMEAFGLNDHIEDVTRRFASEGYYAVAPDLFHRSGLEPAAYDDFTQVMALFEGVTIDTVAVDLDATIGHLSTAGFTPAANVGITGYCWGGWVAFLAAVRQPVAAAVTWYGGGIVEKGMLPFPPLLDEVPAMNTPWLGMFGGLDKGITAAHLDTLQAELDGAALAVETEIVRFPDADHGFHCDGRPDVFNAEAAAAGWARALAWFETNLS